MCTKLPFFVTFSSKLRAGLQLLRVSLYVELLLLTLDYSVISTDGNSLLNCI